MTARTTEGVLRVTLLSGAFTTADVSGLAEAMLGSYRVIEEIPELHAIRSITYASRGKLVRLFPTREHNGS